MQEMKIRRKSKGQFRKGSMDPSVKQAISAGQLERHRRINEALPDLVEGYKKCTQCGRTKFWCSDPVPGTPDSEFPIRSRRLKSTGRIRRYPAGECKKCNAERAAAHREKLRDQGLLSAAQARWNEARDPEARREYQREYQTIQRRMAGVPERGAWKKYRTPSERIKLNAEPLLRYLEDLDTSSLGDQEARRLREAKESGHIYDDVVDRILTALDLPHAYTGLYGDGPVV